MLTLQVEAAKKNVCFSKQPVMTLTHLDPDRLRDRPAYFSRCKRVKLSSIYIWLYVSWGIQM
ncbi:hypothetical protein Hanom_Chr07g00624961 [Helianthus anomalus]